MQHSRIRYKEFLPPVLKPLALYFMENKSAVCVLALLPHDSKPRMALRKAESSSGLGVGGRVSGVGKNQEK